MTALGNRAAGPALRLQDVTKDFGGFRALDGVSFAVERGARFAIIGPNGAGKTTLVGVVSGSIQEAAGRIEIFGLDASRMPGYRRARLGLARTFQITTLFGELTALENVLLALQGDSRVKWMMYGSKTRRDRLGEDGCSLLSEVGLVGREHTAVSGLSHGEQRQLELAVALAGGPNLLLLDEPAAGLSPGERQTLLTLIQQIDPAITIVMIEHNMDVVHAVASEIMVLNHGRIVTIGTPEEVQKDETVQKVYLGGYATDS